MALRDDTRIDKIRDAFRRGMSLDDVARTFRISAVHLTEILRETDARPGHGPGVARARERRNVRASD